MKYSEWRGQRNEQARARLLRNVPKAFPNAVLSHALARPFIPSTLRRAVDLYWAHHPIRADRLARALASMSEPPPGWRWEASAAGPESSRLPPTPFRDKLFARGPGYCCVCGQPVFRFGWHRDLWGERRVNRSATWHGCCVAAW